MSLQPSAERMLEDKFALVEEYTNMKDFESARLVVSALQDQGYGDQVSGVWGFIDEREGEWLQELNEENEIENKSIGQSLSSLEEIQVW